VKSRRHRKTASPNGGGAAGDIGRVPAGTPAPKITASSGSFASTRADVAVCFALEGDKAPALRGVPAGSALIRTLSLLMRQERFRGKRKEVLLWHAAGRHPSARYAVVGLGARADLTLETIREGVGIATRRAVAVRARKAVFVLPPLTLPEGVEGLAEAATEGIALGSYRMSKYLTGEEQTPLSLKGAEILFGPDALKAAHRGVARGKIRALATNLVRDLVNEPALTLTPLRMAEVAREVAGQRGLEIKVLEKKELEKLGMGALLGVSAGSAQPPCLIHMIYRPTGVKGAIPKIALVGKGLTFDSGGLSIKTASSMETMKLDKAGASAVLGVMSALDRLKPAIEVHGIMGMTENMPSGSAIRPGDILRTMSGKTIEVLNTDAEGRLVLADALAYAQAQKVDRIIDLATLTGACMVALGPVVTGVFGNNQEMVEQFLTASSRAGEKMWQLPLYEEYSEQLRSDVADIKNTPTSRYGGAITAGLFLKSFVNGKTPWIHLDLAGPAYLESEQGYMRKGATGATVRTLLTYIEELAD